MQTFLCHQELKQCAALLDNKRLNKQIVEAKQIYASLTGMSEPYGKPARETNSWSRHPATVMWRGYEHYLCMYALFMRDEATRRQIRDNTGMREFFAVRMLRHEFLIPSWWSNPDDRNRIIHSHRCNLARKDWKFYFPKFPELKAGDVFTTPYVWPANLTNH